MRTYIFTVYASMEAKTNNKKLFERELCRPSASPVDYNLIIEALTVLYGTKAIISLTIIN